MLLTFKGLQPDTIEEGLVRNPGIVVTANHCVSAIPYVVDAEPGIKTYLDLPLLAGRAAPQFGLGRNRVILDELRLSSLRWSAAPCRPRWTSESAGHQLERAFGEGVE